MNFEAMQKIFAISFCVIVIYLLMGTYFKNSIGEWFAVVWYIMIPIIIISFLKSYIRNRKPRKKDIVIMNGKFR